MASFYASPQARRKEESMESMNFISFPKKPYCQQIASPFSLSSTPKGNKHQNFVPSQEQYVTSMLTVHKTQTQQKLTHSRLSSLLPGNKSHVQGTYISFLVFNGSVLQTLLHSAEGEDGPGARQEKWRQ